MPDLRLFNPRGAFVSNRDGLRLNGRTYNRGDALKDDTVDLRKRQQLFRHNMLTHPELLQGAEVSAQEPEKGPSSGGSASERTETVVEPEVVSDPVKEETPATADADEVTDTVVDPDADDDSDVDADEASAADDLGF